MQANKKNPFLALLPISFSFTRKPHIFSPFSSLNSRNGSCSFYLFFVNWAQSNAGLEHPVTQFKRGMNYIVAWMSRKAFIIGHGPFRLRMQTYFWSSLNYLGSYRESQERYLQEPSRCMFKSLCRNMNFTKEELCRQKSYDIAHTFENIVFIRHIITFTLDTNLLYPEREKNRC